MFGFKILKLGKMGLLASIAMAGLGGYTNVFAGDVIYPTPQYPTPILPPIMPPIAPPMQMQQQFQAQGQSQFQGQSQLQAQTQGDFLASVDISATYNRFEVNDGTTTTSSSYAVMELRPYLSYDMVENGIEFGGSFYSTLSYEFGGSPAYSLGDSELSLVVKKEGDFAFGASAGFTKEYFKSDSPDPSTGGTFQTLDVSAFAEKRMGQFGLSLTGTYLKDNYDATPQNGGGTYDESGEDNSTYGAALRLNYHIDQSMSVFAEANYTIKQYVTTQVPGNETAYGIRVGGAYNFSNQLALEAAAQYGYHAIECGCETSSYGVDAKLVASLGGNISGSIYGEGEFTISTDPDLDAKNARFGADLSFKAAANVDLSAGAEYEVVLSGADKGSDLSASANINYAVLENLDIFGGVSYGYQTSANPGWSRNYGATVGLSLHN